MKQDLFLAKDFQQVQIEYRKSWTLLNEIGDAISEGDLEKAKLDIYQIQNTVRKLEKFQEKKIQRDQMEALVSRLSSDGVHIEMVVRNL